MLMMMLMVMLVLTIDYSHGDDCCYCLLLLHDGCWCCKDNPKVPGVAAAIKTIPKRKQNLSIVIVVSLLVIVNIYDMRQVAGVMLLCCYCCC